MELRDTINKRIKVGRQILFSKDDEIILMLGGMLEAAPRPALVLWALELAEESVRILEERYPEEERPRQALDMSRKWAAGEIKMPLAQRAILDCHAFAKEINSRADIARCHAIGQACGTVHAKGHAVGYPIYDLTALLRENAEGDWEELVQERVEHYIDRLQYWKENYRDYPGSWAGFLK